MNYYTVLPPQNGAIPIRGGAGELCWLIEGRASAALIDTGCGGKGLFELVGSLTDLPVTILLTHGHRDHIGGVGQFGKAWLHPADFPLVDRSVDPVRRADFVRGKAPELFAQLPEDAFPPHAPTEFLPLQEGTLFDLGGVTLGVYETPGHTPGSVTFADAAHGVLYTGDLCARRTLMMLPESQSLSVLRTTLERLKQLERDFPIQHIGHDPAVPGEGAVDNLLDCVEKILNGRDDHIPFCNVSGSGWLAMATRDAEQQFRADGKYGNIVYNDNSVR